MAAQTTLQQPQVGVDAAVLLDFLRLCDEVTEQLKNGATSLAATMSAILPLGHDTIDVLKKHIEEVTKIQVVMTLDEALGAIIIEVVPPLQSSCSPSEMSDSTGASGNVSKMYSRKRKDIGKIARPKNAFMIYRLDWHSRIVAENPGMHNNDISKIIGRMWREERQAVVDDYKARAQEEKRLHAIAHPDYQYQPRKASEKKRRLSKQKLARLAQTNSVVTTGPQIQAPPNVGGPHNHWLPGAAQTLQGTMSGNNNVVNNAPPFNAHLSTSNFHNMSSSGQIMTAQQSLHTASGSTDGSVSLQALLDAFDFEYASKHSHGAAEGSSQPDPFVEQDRQEQLELEDILNFAEFDDEA